MIRRAIPFLALAVVLGACASSSQSSSTISPAGQPSPAVSPDGQRADRGPGGPGGFRARADEMLLKDITLGADQRARIDSIRASYRAQMAQLRQQAGDDPQAARARMRPLMEKQEAEIRAALTPDQQIVFDKNVADMRARMREGGSRRGAPPQR